MDTGVRGGGTNWDPGTDTYTLPCVNLLASGSYYKAQKAWLCGWVGGRLGGYMHTYSPFTSVYNRNNAVKRSSSD